ncbi:MBL fold metallo-hydrolase [Mesorhizobium sp. M4B.F.Ca.ET.215.01.1.1]|uniref:MBL fold metallo-hydrolase n=1 Tax=unclassified Mesorhizobium TaxID=325217 RepID=UPI000FCCB663|nr:MULTISPECIES: MBL fold metallo-hydrolase [unclassified Mesorhizobium]RUW26355.1 MBL fold metallo-hydrolase [Mesorhizobium sp. M4B.F.Ca.ET.013.02.1.1]RVD42694.1 MBL fold metallo-hydrolase [Mesorhizobium sp. M4B.F.Ca.ET.019.03.1.1]RWF64486.1 MAG: MBL fold metallo-hydrolase [Mesorhizobium sp.]TGQ14093.1 MBL fold metallo-hydrolase [Mesorhizobium sp. M4B.F.Ca.ET.215.01.1.1]TGQ41620.1 MBL fold metallo-hydrolase [Mesorhizobium sp. M4B.F.Ca.ET.214.01.1.1]
MTRPSLGSTMRLVRPAPNVVGFYDGRLDGVRIWSEEPNWLDDGAYTLGICTYAIVDGSQALVYDTHISLPHARLVRRTLEEMGVTSIRVVLSHWHDDHIAGNEVFHDCEIIANRLTASALERGRAEIEGGNPPIRPLVLPNRIFDNNLHLTVGAIPVELRQVEIHSHDGTVLLMPDAGLLLAGDTLEDSITYVSEPERLAEHLIDLERMAGWRFDRILPNHGSCETIAAGGYDRSLIAATQAYVRKLLACRQEPDLAKQDLRTFGADMFASTAVEYFAPYEAVHRQNVEAVLAAKG